MDDLIEHKERWGRFGCLPSMPPRRGHDEKTHRTHIPRPPNAFILFRSSFIRSKHVPGKVEGNHSTLSKIIGLSGFCFVSSLLMLHRPVLEGSLAARTTNMGRKGAASTGRTPDTVPRLALDTGRQCARQETRPEDEEERARRRRRQLRACAETQDPVERKGQGPCA